MSFNNVVPGYIARDPEKLAALMEAMGYPPAPIVRREGAPSSVLQSVLPGMEDLVVEDETPEAQYMDELGVGNLTSTIYRVVDEQGKEYRSSNSTALNKPYYATKRGAKSAATYMSRRLGIRARVQKGEVTWSTDDEAR